MSLSVPFWNWFWHIVGLCAILAICLPSKTLKKISLRMSLHHPISALRVTQMKLGDNILADEFRADVVSYYNEANFLYKRPRVPKIDETLEKSMLVWTLQTGRRKEQQYTVLPGAGENLVDVIRRRGRRTVAFTLQSYSLRSILDSKKTG